MFYLLDGGGAGLFYALIGIGLLFFALAILVEALVMLLMKYHIFRKALSHSLVVNLASLLAGFVFLEFEYDWFDVNTISGFALMYGITVIIEGIVLYLMNKKTPIRKTVLTTLVMNAITYLVLFFFTDMA